MTERCGFTALTGPRVLLLALLLACFGGSAWAQDEQGSDEDDSATLNRITVTGSRIKRTEMEGPAPVIVIDRLEMSERGYTTVFEALSDLTINNGFKFEGAESALFTPDVQTINLRGFGVGTTLTLINGRRLTNYPAAYQSNATVFSYGSIPVAAIERIEILSTSASAIYGSDAVAGVVNIILRSNIDETTVNVLWGTPTETKSTRNDIRLQVVNGKTFDRGSYTLTAEYSKRDGIQGRHYDEYDNQQDDFPYILVKF
jgi:outer membrane receptor for ferrienterochelin and colicin